MDGGRPLRPDADLGEQLARLEELEERLALGAGGTRAGTPDERAADDALPVALGLPPPPPPLADRLDAYLRWLDEAIAILDDRARRGREERERVDAQWRHVLPRLPAVRPEEVAEVVAGQVRACEVLAAIATAEALLRVERERVGAWARAAGGRGDPALLRRLLDEADRAAQRAMAIASGEAVEVLAATALDLDVAARRPGSPEVVAAILAARDRLADAAERLHRPPLGENLAAGGPRAGETPERICTRWQERLDVSLSWAVAEELAGPLAGDVVTVVDTCLGHLAEVAPGSRVEVTAAVTAQSTLALRVACDGPALFPDGEPGWLLRVRLRVALVGGRVLCGQAADGTFLEARFPRPAIIDPSLGERGR